MFVLVGCTLTLLGSFLAFNKSRSFWLIMARKIVLELKYQLLGTREIFFDFVQSRYNKTDLPKKTGCVAIVTGGTRGIGASVVKMFLQSDMDVIIACRRIEAGEKVIEHIRKSGTTTGKAAVYHLDNMSLDSVRKFAEEIKKGYTKVNILVNNAGIMFTPYEETVDGFEHQWAVNYLSHFLLTALLMPLLRNAGSSENSARIISVSSCAHLLGQLPFSDINNKAQFISTAAYAQSKLAQVVFTKSLDQLLKEKNLPIRAFAVHPGIVNTDLFDNSYLNSARWLRAAFFKTPQQGATSIVYAAVNKNLEDRGGAYISNCLEATVSPLVNDKSVQEKLMAVSLEQAQLKNFFQYL
ncbi:retinol dehydrogenase 12 [Fopius arisanus]|uniref:Retinol dehydrogenase 12 n=1 Tax=Fopius arisanus TaxID=64838 RepID=A0A9R1TFL9_9HYME|nr:PREDICTED: retinol dehydrogenase 12 [Fopius arisanus]XP_011308762.1 PREDICTED: retinol dehydrogenase 12 [Fopius arisanus]